MSQGREQISFELPEHVMAVAKTLSEAGHEAYVVGGCVRDLIMDRPVNDWDMTTNVDPETIQNLFTHTVYENDFGTVGVVFDAVEDPKQRVIEVTPYRKEQGYGDNRRPDAVSFGVSLEEDLARRDFTINALAYDPIHHTIVDLHGGIADLHRGLIRSVGDPSERFGEDALRLLRAVRIASQLNGTIEEKTAKAVKEHAERITGIATERVRDELSNIIMHDNPAVGIRLLSELGLLVYIIPELQAGVGVEQNQAHSFDVFEHSLRTVEHAGVRSFPFAIRLAALLHDIGKVPTREWSKKKRDWTFYAHEVVGTKMVRSLLKRLRFSNEVIKQVTLLVRWHMFFSDPDEITLSGVRRMIARVGEDNIWDLVNLRRCDRIGSGRPKEQPYRLRKYIAYIDEVLREPVTPGTLCIDGTTLMKQLSCKPGPRIGHLLHVLLAEVLDDPKKNTEEALIARAKELNSLSDDELARCGKEGRTRTHRENEEQVRAIRKKRHVS